MKERASWLAILLLLGIGWGYAVALAKIVISTGHGNFGLIFWQLIITILVLGCILVVRGTPVRLTGRRIGFAALIACTGTILPNSMFYMSIYHLPAGIMSVLIATGPLFAFPIAVLLGADRFSLRRVAGLLCGLLAVAIITRPGLGLPDSHMTFWIFVAMISPFSYAIEANIIGRYGTAGLDAVPLMFVASTVGAFLTLPLVIASGQWFWLPGLWGKAEQSLVVFSSLHAVLYVSYVALAARTGAVFASQTSYIVTIAGVLWAMGLLGEQVGSGVWLAIAVLFAGLVAVAPKSRARGDDATPASDRARPRTPGQ